MACSLQKLFTVEEEFEDEDFLSAVEDAENRLAGSRPMKAGCLRPASSGSRDSGQLPSGPAAPSEASGPSTLGLRLPTSSMPGAIRGPPSVRTAPLRPVPTSSSWSGHQRRAALTEVLKEPARLQTSTSCHLLRFESRQPVTGGFEGPEQDEFDKVLASMELDLGVSSEAPGIPPTWHQEVPAGAKRARVAELSASRPKGPVPAPHTPGVLPAHREPPEPVVHCRTPQPRARSGTTGDPLVPAQQPCWGACQRGPPLQALQPPQAAGTPVQSSPQNRFPGHSFPCPGASIPGKSHPPRPETPNSICSTPARTVSGSFPWSPSRPRVPMSSVRCPLSTPKSSSSSPVPQAALQTPIVTNHLVRLVTAAHRTLQQPAHPKTRRFPGPAGVLPHQHSGKHLEEIMVSTPHTPTHGALAKFRTEIVTSSQASAEEDFGRGPWLAMKSSLGLDERDPTSFLRAFSIVMVLRKAALKQLPRNKVPRMAVMIKSLRRSAMDASVVFKDPTGEMRGTVHRLLLEARQSELKPGSVLLLKQVGVFSPSLRNHYLNVTPNNLVHVYSPDSGDGNVLQPSQPFPRNPGSLPSSLCDEAAKSGEGFGTAQRAEAGASPEEELPEADDLDGLLSELPEDFFCGTSTSSWDCPKAGPPP